MPEVRWGLGGALPIQFSSAGYSVVILSRSKENLIDLENHINGELEGSCEAIQCDVTDTSSVNKAFEKIYKDYISDVFISLILINCKYRKVYSVSYELIF